MSECMTQEDAMNMSNEQAVAILKPLMNMMRDQYGCPISDAYFALDKAITALLQLQRLQPQRMKGKWIRSEESRFRPYMCSNCGALYDVDTVFGDVTWKFCPNCGADMRGEQDG